jgi:hypothetical protein
MEAFKGHGACFLELIQQHTSIHSLINIHLLRTYHVPGIDLDMTEDEGGTKTPHSHEESNLMR